MNIDIIDLLKIKNMELKIIDIINDYTNELIIYEMNFFNNINDYIDKKFLSLYLNGDFSYLFNNELLTEEKIKLLKLSNLEPYDIENLPGILVEYNDVDKEYYFKWLIFKSKEYEKSLDSSIISRFKYHLLKSNKNNSKKFSFNIDEIINITLSNTICLHCIMMDYIKLSTENNIFLQELKNITNV